MTIKVTLKAVVDTTRRVGVAEAKARLSEVLRESMDGPVVIHNRGHDQAVVISNDEFRRLQAAHPAGGGAAFLARIDAIKDRMGGGVDHFEPGHLGWKPAAAFDDERG